MTCIAAVVSDEMVVIGGDGGATSGWAVSSRKEPKVFRNGEFLMGFTTAFRMGQLLRYRFDPPYLVEGGDLMRYMVVDFAEAVRGLFKASGYSTVKDGQESGGVFLVGVRGRLFRIDDDFHVGSPRNLTRP